MRFRATLELGGKTATGIEVPAEVVAALGSSKRPAVRVGINGHNYASTIAVMGGRYLLPVSAENRSAAGIAAGDEIDIEVVLDDQPRVVVVPADLAAAIDGSPEAGRRFAALSFSHQRAHVMAVEAAKAPATRERRVAKVIESLLGS